MQHSIDAAVKEHLRLLGHLLIGSSLFLMTNPAHGQQYPQRAVRILTSVAGGFQDLAARSIAIVLTDSLGQPVIVDNRAAYMSMELAAKASADGHTLLMASASLWLLQFMRSDVPWDLERDFAPITLAVNSPNIIAVHPSLPVKSVKDLIAWAKARPGQLNYSSGQAGSSSHLAGEMFNWMAGTKIVRIAYKGSAPATMSLLSGEVQVMFPNAGGAMPYVNSGRIRPLALASRHPSILFPGLTTAAQAGLPNYESGALLGVYAPAKTPEAVITRLNREIVRALNRPDVKRRFIDSGADVIASSPAELVAEVKSDMAVTGKLIKELGIRAE